jgi:hypothetical protein
MERMDRILGGDLRNVGNITMDNSNVLIERRKMDKDWWIQLFLVIIIWFIGMSLLGFL